MAGLKIKKGTDNSKSESDNSLKVKTTTKEPEKKTDDEIPVTDEVKGNWNKYLDWLDKKGVRGKPELDKGDLGNKYFRQYLKENPDSGLSDKHIPSIRKAYLQMRDQGIADAKAGKIRFTQGASENNFMQHIVKNESSRNPNYVGQHLTQTRFPGSKYSETINGVKKEVVTNQRPASAEATTAMNQKLIKQ